jgi:hypothetical protein
LGALPCIFYFIFIYFFHFFFLFFFFGALRRAFFCEANISKIKGQAWDLHKLGRCVFFLVGDLKFIRVSNWVVQWFGIRIQTHWGGDLTWGLPKLQIGCFNGLESQSKPVEG